MGVRCDKVGHTVTVSKDAGAPGVRWLCPGASRSQLMWNPCYGRFDGEGWVGRLAALVLSYAAMPHCSQHHAGVGAEAAASAHA
jgi:hypothetical protein